MTNRATLLKGTTIVELGDFFSAAYCTKVLADLGADVIKVEPLAGDSSRQLGPFREDELHHECSGLFAYLNTNKRSITIDIQAEDGREILRQLLQNADVLVENLGQALLRNLGLDREGLKAACPELIVTSISSFGNMAAKPTNREDNLVAFHASGYAQIVGGLVDDPNATPPVKAAEYQADLLAGINAASASIVSLLGQGDSKVAKWNDVAARDSVIPFVFSEIAKFVDHGTVLSRRRADNPPNSVVVILPARDGQVAISPREEHLWKRWIEVMGNPEWASDPRFQNRDSRAQHWDEIYDHLATWSSDRPKAEVAALAQEARVPSFAINDIRSVFDSEQIEWRQFFRQVHHPDMGTVRIPGVPYRLSSGNNATSEHSASPRLGEHNEEILQHTLGYSSTDVDQFRQTGVIGHAADKATTQADIRA